MAYLVVNNTKSYYVTDNYNKPYIKVNGSILPLTSNGGGVIRCKDSNGNTYRPMEYKSQSASNTYYTTMVNSDGLSSTTALTRSSTSGESYETRSSTSGTSYGTVVGNIASYLVHTYITYNQPWGGNERARVTIQQTHKFNSTNNSIVNYELRNYSSDLYMSISVNGYLYTITRTSNYTAIYTYYTKMSNSSAYLTTYTNTVTIQGQYGNYWPVIPGVWSYSLNQVFTQSFRYITTFKTFNYNTYDAGGAFYVTAKGYTSGDVQTTGTTYLTRSSTSVTIYLTRSSTSGYSGVSSSSSESSGWE